jgi:formate dehydrogenase subunit delta
MNIHHLVKMANDIGAYYEAFPDRSEAVVAVAAHLKNFWEPRMRREIIDYANQEKGEASAGHPQLKEIVRAAILTLQ